MKEIYVYKQLIMGWKGISKEEAEEMIKEGRVFGAELEMDRGEGESIKITLLKDNLYPFGATEKKMHELMDEYFAYVEEITGMTTIQT